MMTKTPLPKNVQEAKNIDSMYMQEIETKLGLLNQMVNKWLTP